MRLEQLQGGLLALHGVPEQKDAGERLALDADRPEGHQQLGHELPDLAGAALLEPDRDEVERDQGGAVAEAGPVEPVPASTKASSASVQLAETGGDLAFDPAQLDVRSARQVAGVQRPHLKQRPPASSYSPSSTRSRTMLCSAWKASFGSRVRSMVSRPCTR